MDRNVFYRSMSKERDAESGGFNSDAFPLLGKPISYSQHKKGAFLRAPLVSFPGLESPQNRKQEQNRADTLYRTNKVEKLLLVKSSTRVETWCMEAENSGREPRGSPALKRCFAASFDRTRVLVNCGGEEGGAIGKVYVSDNIWNSPSSYRDFQTEFRKCSEKKAWCSYSDFFFSSGKGKKNKVKEIVGKPHGRGKKVKNLPPPIPGGKGTGQSKLSSNHIYPARK